MFKSLWKILGTHGREYDDSVLGYCGLYCLRSLQTFRSAWLIGHVDGVSLHLWTAATNGRIVQAIYEHREPWLELCGQRKTWFIHQRSLVMLPAESSSSKQKDRAKEMMNLALRSCSIASAGFEAANLGSSGKPSNHYTTEATSEVLTDEGRTVSILASYSGGPGFKSRTGDRLSWLRFFVVFSDPPVTCCDSTLNEVTTASFHVLSNSSLTYHPLILVWVTGKALLNKLQTQKCYCLHQSPDNGDSKHLRNVRPTCTRLHGAVSRNTVIFCWIVISLPMWLKS
jgi:hypothetical protein